MKQNSKFLTIYIAILFSFVIIFILFAGLSSLNSKETANQGIQNNLIEITNKYQQAIDENTALSKALDDARDTIESYEDDVTQKASYVLASEKIIESFILYEQGDEEQARDAIKGIDKTKLTENQLYIYNKIME